jgi:DNA-binding NarL/FixJ family response regulator
MPDGSGFEATRRIAALESPPPVIVVTVRDDFDAVRAVVEAGARGFVVKSAASDELLAAVRAVMDGRTYVSPLVAENPSPLLASPLDALTSRELEVLLLVAQGLSAKQIASRLGISERTVNFHKDRMKHRLGVKTTIEAVNLLRVEGIRPV